MHELGIADAMMKMVDRIAKENELTKVNSITVEVGNLSGVIPSFLADSWEAVIDRTKFCDVSLKIEEVMGTLRCEDCKNEFTADLENLTCPKCRGNKLTPLTGRDMTILEIKGD